MTNEGFRPAHDDFAWLADHASGWQFGESGILLAIARRLFVDRIGYVVEIGAGNGNDLPVACDALIQDGWIADLYEQDGVSVKMLREKYDGQVHVRIHHQIATVLPTWGDIAIIDIDGNDFEIWTEDTPVVMIEHMDIHSRLVPEKPCIPPPEWCGKYLINGADVCQIQANEAALDQLAAQRGYVRIGGTRVNSIYVLAEHADKLRMPLNQGLTMEALTNAD